ncbi:MAG: tetratricopeptide repeat protein [Chloroflexi bacterium]|nr:tetratricopeptide repeat protein [Chloroflexota bacterium]
MASQKLDQAVALIKAGNKQAAFPILKDLIQEEPNNEQVWLWMFTCVDKPEQKKYCLQKALEINPNNADARKAFDRLSGKESLPSSVQSARSQSQRQSVHKKLPAAPLRGQPVSQTAGKKQPVASRNMLFIVGLIATILLCSSVGIGGYWVYGNYFANEPQAFSPDESPLNTGDDPADSNQNTDIEENSFPTPIIVEPENEDTPTATVDGVYDIRITPISYTKTVEENDPQWSNLEVTLAVENYSHETLVASFMGILFKIKTEQGFEYECQDRNIKIGLVPSNFRKTIVIHFCRVPTDSSIYNIYGTIDIRKSDANAYSGYSSSFDVNIENFNTGLSFPLIDRNYYLQQNLPLYGPNQAIDLTDMTISFGPPIYSEEHDDGVIINYTVQNKIAGDKITVSIGGNLFFNDGNSTLFCLGEGDDGGYLSVDINSTSSGRLLCGSMDTISSPLDSSCLAITQLGIGYSNSTKEETIIRNLVVCF